MKHLVGTLLVAMAVLVTSACLVVVLKSRGKFQINMFPTLSLHEDKVLLYKSLIHQTETEQKSGKAECTVLMPSYRREKMLPQILGHYCNKLSPLSRIVLVWNDPSAPVPRSLVELKKKCNKELSVIPMKENKLTNRFLPQNLEEIQTDCKLRMQLRT